MRIEQNENTHLNRVHAQHPGSMSQQLVHFIEAFQSGRQFAHSVRTDPSQLGGIEVVAPADPEMVQQFASVVLDQIIAAESTGSLQK